MCSSARSGTIRPASRTLAPLPSSARLRVTYQAARRAGLRRCLYRLERVIRLRALNPRLGSILYPLPQPGPVPVAGERQRAVLERLVELRRASPSAGAWDRRNGTLSLLNQSPVSLRAPVDWDARPVDDPLWAFRLHGWAWAWPALRDRDSRDPFLSLCHDWIDRVPVGQGLGWQPYPTSRRLVVWSAAWHLLGGDETMAAAIAQQAAYLADHLERDLDNNHLVANAKALAWVGLLFSDLERAKRWRELGLSLLWETLDAQVRADGGHVENATSYHLAVWLDGLETAVLCRASGEPVPDAAWGTLERMGDFALALRRPDGRLPLLGDSIEDEPLPASALFGLAAEAFDRPDFAWAAGDAGAPEPEFRSRALHDTGYVVLRSVWGPEDTFLVFDAGELGPSHCPGHGHADTLSIELWGRGEPLILDPGTYQYPAGRWRDGFRGTAAHTTAMVDGLDQSTFAGPFRVADLAHGQLLSADLDGSELVAVGQHDGYTRLDDPVVHRRRLCLRDRDHLTITDTFSGTEWHRIDLRFHLAPCDVELIDQQTAKATYPGGTQLLLKIDGPPGTLSIEEGWISRTWYRKQPSPVLAFCFETQLPATVVTQLQIR